MMVSSLVPSELQAEAVVWRRHLHANPELSFAEHETARFVEEQLRQIGGIQIERPTPTSVVGHLRGGAGPGRVIALRADMDALPIQEENVVEYTSRNPGVMHACGHDGHTAMLLATAKGLAGRRDQLSGEVRFVFQHAEETPPGGARELVDAGVTDGVDMIVGAHLISNIPAGTVVVLEGAAMAATDVFTIEVRGSGGHAAMPHLSVDPIPIAAQLITGLQQIVSRTVSPLESAVVSVTRVAAGTTTNVIPEVFELQGTARSFSPETRDLVRRRLEDVARGITEAHGASFSFEYMAGYDAVVNDPAVASFLKDVARRELGEAAVGTAAPMMGGEDFSAYLERLPGAFIWLGAGNDAIGAHYPHHHPRFAIDESVLASGIALLQRAVIEFLARSR